MQKVVEEELACDSITIYGAEIIGVQSLQKYLACVSCNANKMGTCLKCEMTQPASRCNEKQPARLYIQHEQQYLNLSAFDEILSAIAGTSNVTATTLLESL